MTKGKGKLEEVNEISRNNQEALEKLAKIEEKLKIIREFTDQAQQLQQTRKRLENLVASTDQAEPTKKKLREKVVTFSKPSVHDQSKESLVRTESKQSVLLVQRSKPLQELLNNLHTWHTEVKEKMHTIETLKARKSNVLLLDEEYKKFDKEIKELEIEKGEMDEKLLYFVLKNVTEGKQEYVELVAQLEDENRDMEDRVDILIQQINSLKELNTALLLENEYLRHKPIASGMSSSMSLADDKYRKSIIEGKASAIFPDSLLSGIGSTSSLRKTSTTDIEEREDRLSLDRETLDSFKLDQKLEGWKMDEQTIHEKVKRIGNDLHQMKVNNMKLNLVKRYVRKHGVKTINRDTLIDPLKAMGGQLGIYRFLSN